MHCIFIEKINHVVFVLLQKTALTTCLLTYLTMLVQRSIRTVPASQPVIVARDHSAIKKVAIAVMISMCLKMTESRK